MRSKTVETIYATVIPLRTGTLFLSVFINVLASRRLVTKALLLFLLRGSIIVVIFKLVFCAQSSTSVTTTTTLVSTASAASTTSSTTSVTYRLGGIYSSVSVKRSSGK